MSNQNNSEAFFGLIVIALSFIITGYLLLDNGIESQKESATKFCSNMPDSCDCRVNITNVGFGRYAHKSYYVTYKQNGKNITEEF